MRRSKLTAGDTAERSGDAPDHAELLPEFDVMVTFLSFPDVLTGTFVVGSSIVLGIEGSTVVKHGIGLGLIHSAWAVTRMMPLTGFETVNGERADSDLTGIEVVIVMFLHIDLENVIGGSLNSMAERKVSAVMRRLVQV